MQGILIRLFPEWLLLILAGKALGTILFFS
jgi:hypothetical protein